MIPFVSYADITALSKNMLTSYPVVVFRHSTALSRNALGVTLARACHVMRERKLQIYEITSRTEEAMKQAQTSGRRRLLCSYAAIGSIAFSYCYVVDIALLGLVLQ